MEVNWRAELEEILDNWGEITTDDDVCDLPESRLKVWLDLLVLANQQY